MIQASASKDDQVPKTPDSKRPGRLSETVPVIIEDSDMLFDLGVEEQPPPFEQALDRVEVMPFRATQNKSSNSNPFQPLTLIKTTHL